MKRFKLFRRICGGTWLKIRVYFAPGIPMGGFTCWERKSEAQLGRGCGSYSEVLETEEY